MYLDGLIVLLDTADIEAKDDVNITAVLSESKRVQLIKGSATPGGRGVPVVLSGNVGAFFDMGHNFNLAFNDVLVIEYADDVSPTIVSAILDLNLGLLRVTGSEPIGVTYLNTSQIVLRNDNVTSFSITGSKVFQASEEREINITLPETLRASLVRYTDTPGGDGEPLTLDVLTNGLQDMGLNPNVEALNVSMVEIGDITPPSVIGATLRLTEGQLILNMSETIDAEVGGRLTMFNYVGAPYPINMAKLFISNSADNNNVGVSLVGATVKNESTTTLVFHLTEVQRAALIVISGTTGGDGVPTVLNIQSGAFHDMSINPNEAAVGISIVEFADTEKPFILAATLNFGTSVLRVDSSETLSTDASKQRFDLAFLRNLSLSVNDTNSVNLDGSEILNAKLDYFELRIPELSRVQMLYFSSQSIGDGTPLVLDIGEGAFTDLAENAMNAVNGLKVTEIADTIKPSVLSSATINYADGTLRIPVTETLDRTPEHLTDLSKIFLADSTNDSAIPLQGASIVAVDTTLFTITLTELQRVQAIALSNTQGGDGSPMVLDMQKSAVVDLSSNYISDEFNITLIETDDYLFPYLKWSSLNFSTGELVLSASETIDLTPKSKVALDAAEFVNEADGSGTSVTIAGADFVEIDTTTITLVLTEDERVNAYRISSQVGGDGTNIYFKATPTLFKDIAQNPLNATKIMMVNEINDTSIPFVKNVTLNYSTGMLSLFISETVDLVPISNLRLDTINISNDYGSILPTKTFHLNDSSVVEADAVVINILLSEFTRNAAQRIAGTTGGDGTAALLEISESSFLDLGLNDIPQTNFEVFEIPDTVPPAAFTGSINYTNGIVVIQFTETLGISNGLIDLSKSFLANYKFDIYHEVGLAFRRYESEPAQSGFNYIVMNWDARESEDYVGTTTFP